VLWIGCSDSRVRASGVTASMPGDIFTHQNIIANQFHSFDDNANSVPSFAVSEAVGVDHVVPVGHSICGGVQAAAGAEPNNLIERWSIPLTELIRTLDLSGLDESEALEVATEASINKQVENICSSEPIVTAWAAGRRVSVHGWLYDLATGRIRKLVVRSLPYICSVFDAFKKYFVSVHPTSPLLLTNICFSLFKKLYVHLNKYH
ncbi:carbonic anhydrase, partial [Suillus spraguei]